MAEDDGAAKSALEHEFEDEEEMFAKHDRLAVEYDIDRPRGRSGRRLFFIGAVLCFLCLIVLVIALSIYFLTTASGRGGALEACKPERVQVPQVSNMTLPEKVGQMMQVDHLALDDTRDVATYFIGSILSGGGGAPKAGNTAVDWANMVDDLQAKAATTRLRIPLVYGADAVHGHNNVWGATIIPHHVGLGAARNPELVQQLVAAVALEVMGTGVRWTFSPAVSICQDPRWGRCYESFGFQPQIVSMLGLAEVAGWQNPPNASFYAQNFIAATAKHFVGDGGTKGGVDRGDTECSEFELEATHLPPYAVLSSANVQAMMVSYSSWNGVPMHENRNLLTDKLRLGLGFKGVLISDWGAVQLLPGNLSEQVMKAINAGIDMVMVPTDYKNFSATLIQLVESGQVSMERVDEAVGRILEMKQLLGLFDDACARREYLKYVGWEEHRALARHAVRESMVLLKNVKRGMPGTPLFPLAVHGKKVLVVGRHANDLGRQCGGWTISWQGSAGRITVGTTIFEGFQEVAGARTEFSYQESYDGAETADLGIVVVGEEPYAEYGGDSKLLGLNDTNVQQITSVCAKMECVVIVITGRALDVIKVVPQIDALIVAWLPGSEGAGVGDVLFGSHDFKGRLPYPWFTSVDFLPLGAAEYIPHAELFAFGFGLNKAGRILTGVP